MHDNTNWNFALFPEHWNIFHAKIQCDQMTAQFFEIQLNRLYYSALKKSKLKNI